MTTIATAGGVTLTRVVARLPSTTTVITAVPSRSADSVPLGETATMRRSLELHVIAWPLSVLPWSSLGAAVSTAVSPNGMEVAGGISTLATGAAVAVTMTVPVPLRPSLVAMMLM